MRGRQGCADTLAAEMGLGSIAVAAAMRSVLQILRAAPEIQRKLHPKIAGRIHHRRLARPCARRQRASLFFGRAADPEPGGTNRALNQDIENLVLLQAQDLEMGRLRGELEAAPKRVSAAETARAAAEAAQLAADRALSKEEALRRTQESDVQDRRLKIARLRKQMDSAVSAAQITALEHEIGFAETAIAGLEDEELASMERSERFEGQRAEARRWLVTATAALETTRHDAAELTQRHRAAIAALEAERSGLRRSIPEALLNTYDRIAKSRGSGVAEAVDGQCSACQMKLRPQRWNDLTGREHDGEIFTCESCGRILFRDPRRDAPGTWLPGDRLRAASTRGENRP